MQCAVNIATIISACIDVILFVIAVWTFINTYLISNIKILTITQSSDIWSCDKLNFVIKSMSLKTIVINEVYAVFDNKYRLKIAKYDEPIIIEAFRSVKINMESYTSMSPLSLCELFLSNGGKLNVHLELITDENKTLYSTYKGVKYKIDKKADLIPIFLYVSRFNDIVIREDFKYALLYKIGEKSDIETAFINNFGIISTNVFGFNKISIEYLNDETKLIEIFQNSCKEKGITFNIVDLKNTLDTKSKVGSC